MFALREPFYREFLVTFPPWEAVFTLEMIPAALALCHISRGDAAQALIGAANLGRDSDTIGSMVGELMGALYGVATFPASWVEQLNRLNPTPTLSVMADELVTIIEEQARAEQQRSAEVLRLASA